MPVNMPSKTMEGLLKMWLKKNPTPAEAAEADEAAKANDVGVVSSNSTPPKLVRSARGNPLSW